MQIPFHHNGSVERPQGSKTELPNTPTPADPADPHRIRQQRIADYRQAALDKADPLQANLSSVNGNLMAIAARMGEAIEGSLDSGSDPVTLDRLKKLLPIIETHLRVNRQIDRLAQLERREAAARKPPSD